MSEIECRWKDMETGDIHSLVLHGAHFGHYREAETACGIKVESRIHPTAEEVSCAACLDALEGPLDFDALQRAMREWAREPVPA